MRSGSDSDLPARTRRMKYRFTKLSDGSGYLTGEWKQGKKVRKVWYDVDQIPTEKEHALTMITALQDAAHRTGRPVLNDQGIRGGTK